MSEEFKIGCARPNNLVEDTKVIQKKEKIFEKMEETKMIKVGKSAPVFKAQAYKSGKFINVDLEELKGKWVVLCFYPGDFTFV